LIFSKNTARGAPVVNPFQVPLINFGKSGSLRGVVPGAPLRRRERSPIKSASVRGIPGGMPSITTPMPFPCDSPKMLSLKICPNVFIVLILQEVIPELNNTNYSI
jgi:hypothetical protein